MTRTGIRLLSALLLLIMLPDAGAASAEAMPARDAWAIERAKALAARMQGRELPAGAVGRMARQKRVWQGLQGRVARR